MIPKLYTLREASALTGGKLKESTLRREAKAGNLEFIRPRASCNAPILISEKSLVSWLENIASKRTHVPSPTQVAKDQRLCGGGDE